MKPVLAALCIAFGATTAVAEGVTLTSRDGSVVIEGDNAAFDGEFFRLDTVYGPLTIDAAGVICTGPGCPDAEAYVSELVISGAAHSAETLLPALISAFAGRTNRTISETSADRFDLSFEGGDTTEARFQIVGSNADEGFADLLADEAGAVLSLREITSSEEQRLEELGRGTLSDAEHSRVVALDAVVAVVSAENPLDAISLDTLAAVFSGEITNWETLGGPDGPILLFLPEPKSDVERLFERRVLGPGRLEMSDLVTFLDDGSAVASRVAEDDQAIGISLSSATGPARMLAISGSCGHRSVADASTLRAGDYPLIAEHYLYRPAQRLPATIRSFLKFLESLPAQAVVRRAGLTDLVPDRVALEAQGLRLSRAVTGSDVGLGELRRLVQAMAGTERVTTTFRFRNGSTQLDARSQSNVSLLADLIGRGDYDGETLVFAGFTDARGSEGENRRLSRQRADAVMNAVVSAAPPQKRSRVTFETEGFGEAMPIACDEDGWGRRLNRRVEVWVKPTSE